MSFDDPAFTDSQGAPHPPLQTSAALKTSATPVGNLFLMLFGVLSVFFALVFTVWGTVRIVSASHTTQWATTDGIITQSTMGTVVDHGRGGGTSYHADIHYQFVLNGQTLTGTEITWSEDTYPFSSYSESVLKRYPVGAHVPVHYSPDKPLITVLDAGANFPEYFTLGVGLVLGLVSVPVCWFGFRGQL
jgi:hypothetical protein